MRTILLIISLAALFYASVVAGLWIFQRRLIYLSGTSSYVDPADLPERSIEEVRLDTPDGARLVAWQVAAKPGKATLLYFHGNAASLLNRLPRIERFSAAGYGVFMPAYRGYSGSTGTPSEDRLVADAVQIFDFLVNSGLRPRDIVLYGESLGTGVAIRLAGLRTPGGIVLDAPYPSLPHVAKRAYPFVPAHNLMIERFDSLRNIKQVKAPILMMHGTRDRTIPIELGRMLFEAAPAPKTFKAIEGAAHSDIFEYGAFAHLDAFLRGLLSDDHGDGDAGQAPVLAR